MNQPRVNIELFCVAFNRAYHQLLFTVTSRPVSSSSHFDSASPGRDSLTSHGTFPGERARVSPLPPTHSKQHDGQCQDGQQQRSGFGDNHEIAGDRFVVAVAPRTIPIHLD